MIDIWCRNVKQKTVEIEEQLRQFGYNLVIMWEKKWKSLR